MHTMGATMDRRIFLSSCLGLAMAGGAARAQAPLQKLTFAWAANPQTPQVDVATEKGLFRAAGLDIEFVSFPSGRESFEALLGGQVDLAFMAEFPAATGALRHQNFAVIADLTRYRGQRVISSAKTLDLTSAHDLAGKKVGTTLGTNVEFFTDVLLDKAGITAEIVNAGPADLLPALVRGDIDAAVMFPTFYEVAKTTLGANYRELRSTDYILHNVVAASGAALSGKQQLLGKFLGALVQADAAIAQDPAAAQAAVAGHLNGMMKPATLAAMWSDFDIRVQLDADLLSLIAAEGAWMVKRGVVKAPVPTEATFRPYLADGPLKAVAPDRVKLA